MRLFLFHERNWNTRVHVKLLFESFKTRVTQQKVTGMCSEKTSFSSLSRWNSLSNCKNSLFENERIVEIALEIINMEISVR